MLMRPCFNSVWRRRLKFSTLPSLLKPSGSQSPRGACTPSSDSKARNGEAVYNDQSPHALPVSPSWKNIPHGNKATLVYDDKGLLIDSKLDLCDCLEELCPGCHFPCPKCRSNKCGGECRQGRKWQYESLEVEGLENRVKKNLHLVKCRSNKCGGECRQGRK